MTITLGTLGLVIAALAIGFVAGFVFCFWSSL